MGPAGPHPAPRATFSQWEKGSGSLIQPLCMVVDRGDDPLRLGENLLISESENGPAESLQLGLPQMVSQHDVIPVVDPAVDLEDEPEAIAGEVGDVGANGVLAAEFVAVDPACPQAVPQAALSQSGVLTLSARESCSTVGHIAIYGRFSIPSKGPGAAACAEG